MPRRRAGTLIALEQDILRAGLRLGDEGEQFHGFGLAASLRNERHGLIAHGTLYKALARLQEAGLLTAVWEQSEVAEQAKRPRRKLYAVTTAGEAALRASDQHASPARHATLRPSTS
ncbi:PadR family transcriptional regulator [Amnibacterium kyonggiense]|uniref:PadR family transcriptional regulator n=1 Tax=Amnibacterium kyonggiense TaxID=595671 RepID=UPI0013C2EB1B|nr:helix-turn-helix transcriptional regulator [Amnibacterium kyonggiense]